MKTTNAIVRNALAHHLDRDPSTLHAWQHLEIDLFLSPRDLLHIMCEVARALARDKGRAARWSPAAVTPTW